MRRGRRDDYCCLTLLFIKKNHICSLKTFLMWTIFIFKVFIEFVTILLLFYVFWPQGI